MLSPALTKLVSVVTGVNAAQKEMSSGAVHLHRKTNKVRHKSYSAQYNLHALLINNVPTQ